MLKRIRTLLIALHLYLGVALCLLFVVWFVSGIAMAYYRSPVLTDATRLAFAEPLSDTPAVQRPAAVPGLAAQWSEVETLRLAQWGGRPLYRWLTRDSGWQSAWADDGSAARFDAAALRAEAQRWLETDRIEYRGAWQAAGQWSYFSAARAHYPLHRYSSGGWAAREVLLSSRTGEVVVATTLPSRLLYYLGPGLHYLSFYPIRNDDPLWRGLVNWSSGLGAAACLFGLVLGLWRLRWHADHTDRRLIPYTRFWMYWHHWTGLAFGSFTLTFVLSGLFSMNPAKIFPPTEIPDPLQQAWRGPAPPLEAVPALGGAGHRPGLREYEYRRIRGAQFSVAVGEAGDQRLFQWQGANWRPRPPFTAAELRALLQPVSPARIVGHRWLRQFDTYYYARKERAQPLPALRVELGDARRTWLYLEPASGRLFLRSDQGTRTRRWLYNGLHSLDFPFLLARERLWEVVIWLLSLCGLALSVTSTVIAWKWLRRRSRARAAATTPSRHARLEPAAVDSR
ncbi:MAG: PepSY domain-containing protein [Steroidobacteraceae bacterium]|jgi:hypothetical protein|nr:PepSY domain-containing protein [Steroidobacteraceae bacterium]